MSEGSPSRWLCACLLVVWAAGCRPVETPPHVVLIAVDTLRRDHCSVYGYARETTPALRRVAEQGTVLDAAYAPMSVTGPSVATLLTGRYPIRHGVVRNGLRLGAEETTLAERLASQGYRTAAFVSSFVLERRFGFDQGFSVYEDRFAPDEASSPDVASWEGIRVDGAFDRRAGPTTDRALRWLEEASAQGSPFFLFVHYFDPHSPYRPPDGIELRFPIDSQADELGHAIRRYDGEIAYVDAQVGRLLEALEQLGEAERTLLVVTADHGEGLGERGYLFHGAFVYEEEVRVPLLLRWPGRIAAGRVLEEPVELGDLTPTILDLVGAPPLADAAGRSLAAALREDAPLDPSRPVFLHRRPFEPGWLGGRIPVSGELFAVREGRWKLVSGSDPEARELFDLAIDPGERRNLLAAEPERARRLAAVLSGWRRERSAPRPPLETGADALEGLRALGYGD